MTQKTELVRELNDLEAEYRFWLVEAIAIERSMENIEEQIDQHEAELGPERTVEFRVRLTRTRERHQVIEEKMRYVRERLDELHTRLDQLP
jgi:chromosome segregation ATPase